jgi:hypothetical protein
MILKTQMSSFMILPKTSSYNEFIILPETTVSFFEALEQRDQLSDQEKTEILKMYQEIFQQLKTHIAQLKTEADLRNAQLEAELRNAELKAEVRNAQLEAELRNAELKAEVRNAQLEAELRNAQLEADLRNAELAELKEKLNQKDKFVLDYWEKMRNLLNDEKKMKKELEASNMKLEASNMKLEAELDWYHKQCSRQRSCGIITELPALKW